MTTCICRICWQEYAALRCPVRAVNSREAGAGPLTSAAQHVLGHPGSSNNAGLGSLRWLQRGTLTADLDAQRPNQTDDGARWWPQVLPTDVEGGVSLQRDRSSRRALAEVVSPGSRAFVTTTATVRINCLGLDQTALPTAQTRQSQVVPGRWSEIHNHVSEASALSETFSEPVSSSGSFAPPGSGGSAARPLLAELCRMLPSVLPPLYKSL